MPQNNVLQNGNFANGLAEWDGPSGFVKYASIDTTKKAPISGQVCHVGFDPNYVADGYDASNIWNGASEAKAGQNVYVRIWLSAGPNIDAATGQAAWNYPGPLFGCDAHSPSCVGQTGPSDVCPNPLSDGRLFPGMPSQGEMWKNVSWGQDWTMLDYNIGPIPIDCSMVLWAWNFPQPNHNSLWVANAEMYFLDPGENPPPLQQPETCPPGYHYDAVLKGCAPDTPTCPAGQHWDATQNACVPDVPVCPNGYHWDATQNACVKNSGNLFGSQVAIYYLAPKPLFNLMHKARDSVLSKEVHKKLHPLV